MLLFQRFWYCTNNFYGPETNESKNWKWIVFRIPKVHLLFRQQLFHRKLHSTNTSGLVFSKPMRQMAILVMHFRLLEFWELLVYPDERVLGSPKESRNSNSLTVRVLKKDRWLLAESQGDANISKCRTAAQPQTSLHLLSPGKHYLLQNETVCQP